MKRAAGPVLPVLLALLLSAAVPAVEASAPADIASLFPQRAPVTAPGGRLARLDVPAEVLAASRPDLSDLRILDAAGGEVPYAVLEGLAPDLAVEVRETVVPELVGIDQETAEANDRRDREPPARTERFTLAPPPPAPAGERWDLVIVTDRRELVRQASVSALGGRNDGVPAAGERPGRLLWTGSIFRLSGRQPVRERLRIPLPPLGAPAGSPDTVGSLLLTLEGQDDAYLEPGFRYQRVRAMAGPARVRVPLSVLGEESDDGRTVIELERPRGVVADHLVIESSTPALDRRVEVWDRGPGAAGLLGWGRVRRVGGLEGEDGARSGDELPEIALRTPRGDRLRVEIDDGDSPPLEDLRITAAVRRPALVFALPAGGGPARATLYFGGGRALVPRYDLQALAPLPAAGADAEIAERLYDPARLPAAELGAIEGNPRFDAAPALAFAMRPGAVLDRERWAWRRPLEARPSPEGLVRLRLEPADLALARDDLGDLRIVGAADGEEASSRQWAYLVGDEPVREHRQLEIAAVETEAGVTRYELVPPAAPVPLDGLILEVDAPFFDRPFVLEGRRGDRERVLAAGRLVLPPRDPRPVEIALAPAGRLERIERLVLAIENGSDASLDVTGVTGWFPVPEIYFAAPAGGYHLLLGAPGAEPPSYELARVRDVVLTVSAGEAETGALERNPGHRPGLGALLTPRAQRLFLWTVLAGAVAALALLTLRLARREE